MSLLRNQPDIIPDRKKKSRKLIYLLYIFAAAVISYITLFFIYRYYAYPYIITDNSMEPALKKGQLVWINPGPRDQWERGQIVKLTSPLNKNQDDNYCYILRITALPGEKIYIENKTLYINNKKFDSIDFGYSPVKQTFPVKYSTRDNLQEYTVPAGHYFVMGDNWDLSYDSRSFAAVSVEKIIGLVEVE